MNDLQKRLDQLYGLLESSLNLSQKLSTKYISTSDSFIKDDFCKAFEVVKASVDEISNIINLKSNSDFVINQMFIVMSKIKEKNVGM